jgi:hypothetical protein
MDSSGGVQMKTVYLGDGVYAQIDFSNALDYSVILTTGTHLIDSADNVIYLEHHAMELLVEEYINEKNSEL